MTTGKKVASDAAKMLRDPKAPKKEKELADSDLAQAKRKAPSKIRSNLFNLTSELSCPPEGGAGRLTREVLAAIGDLGHHR